jgi:uncharacterized lipoprotein YmbA
VLSSEAAEATVRLPDHTSVGIGPVALPGYLDRPQMVTRPAPTDLRVAEFNQWAEPLRESVVRALGDDLSALLDSDRVYAYPWEARHTPDYRVAVDVNRFEAAGDHAVLVARWTLVRGPEPQVVAVKRSEFDEAVDGSDYSAIARGLSSALARLSAEIAAAIEAAEATQN